MSTSSNEAKFAKNLTSRNKAKSQEKFSITLNYQIFLEKYSQLKSHLQKLIEKRNSLKINLQNSDLLNWRKKNTEKPKKTFIEKKIRNSNPYSKKEKNLKKYFFSKKML